METWQFVSPYVRRPLSFCSRLCSATFRAPGCQFPDMSLVLAWFVPKTEHVLNLEGSRFHFFCGHCKICCIFLPFYFWLPLQDMLHLNFLAPLLFFVPLQDMLHFRFWSLIAPCSIKITLFNKLIFHSTSCVLW